MTQIHRRAHGERPYPERIAAWTAAVAAGVAGELADFVLLHDAHWGYYPDEVPRYAPCPRGCGQEVRADRLDLIAEHLAGCVR